MNQQQKAILEQVNKGRKFQFLPTLDLYIFREFMIPFSVLVFTFILLFLIGDIFNYLSDFLDAKQQHGIFLKAVEFFALKMPGNIRFVLPISILLSCMYTISSLGRCREITAMRASGISMLRCGGAIYAVALITTGVNFWFNEQLVPTCNMDAEVLLQEVKYPGYNRSMYNMLQFRSPDKTRDWLFNNFSDYGLSERVILKQFKPDSSGKHYLIWDLQADSAVYDPVNGWTFRKGLITRYHELLHIPGASQQFSTITFPRNEIRETPYEIKNAVKPPDELSSRTILTILLVNKNMAHQLRCSYETLLYYRLAFPWICFLCVFLGLPIAVKNERSGVFLSIVTAVGAIVLFQILTELFLALGKQGYIPPVIGGLGPTFAFLLYSYFGVIRKSA